MSRSWRICAKKQCDEEGSEIWDKGRLGRRKEEWDVTECKIEAKDEVKEEAKEEMTMNRLHKMVTFGVSRFWLLHVPCGSWSFMIVPTKGLITSDLSSLVLIWELIVLYLSPWSKSFRIPPGTFLELIVYDLSNSTFPFSDLSAYRLNLVFILIHYCGATAMTGDRCPTKTLQSWCVNVAVMLRVGFLCPLSLLLWCHLQVFLEVFIVSNFLSFYHKPVKASPLLDRVRVLEALAGYMCPKYILFKAVSYTHLTLPTKA